MLGSRLGRLFATVAVYDSLPSTNSHAASPQVALPAFVACEHQSAGRGRYGRQWDSGKGRSLTFSVALDLGDTPRRMGLALAAAVGAAEALAATGYAVGLKWPNDLVGPGGGKLGGLLVELHGSGGKKGVIGLGLNLVRHPGFAEALPQAECLGDQDVGARRNGLLVELARQVLHWSCVWRDEGMEKIHAKWLSRTIHKPGDMLSLTTPDGHRRSLAFDGLDKDGGLLARDGLGSPQRFVSAEVSVGPAGG